MNVRGQFRYATRKGAEGFHHWRVMQQLGAGLKAACGLGPGQCVVGRRLEEVVSEARAWQTTMRCSDRAWLAPSDLVCRHPPVEALESRHTMRSSRGEAHPEAASLSRWVCTPGMLAAETVAPEWAGQSWQQHQPLPSSSAGRLPLSLEDL